MIGSLCFSISGLSKIWIVFDLSVEVCILSRSPLFHLYSTKWSFFTPSVIFVLVFVLSVVLCIAVGVMLSWHLYNIARGETTVESHDHRLYQNIAQSRGDVHTIHFMLIIGDDNVHRRF